MICVKRKVVSSNLRKKGVDKLLEPAARPPTRDRRRSNTEYAGAREPPQSRVGAKKGEKNVKRVKKK